MQIFSLSETSIEHSVAGTRCPCSLGRMPRRRATFLASPTLMSPPNLWEACAAVGNRCATRDGHRHQRGEKEERKASDTDVARMMPRGAMDGTDRRPWGQQFPVKVRLEGTTSGRLAACVKQGGLVGMVDACGRT